MTASEGQGAAVSERLGSPAGRQWYVLAYWLPATAIGGLGGQLLAEQIGLHPLVGIFGLLALLVAVWIPFVAVKSTVVAGDDGIHVSWLGTQTFYSYDEVDVVARTETNGGQAQWFTIRLSSGKELSYPGKVKAIDRLVQRVQEAQLCYERRGAAEELVQLKGGAVEPRERLAELRALAAGATAGPRTAPPAEERLWRLLESPQAGDGERAAAAVTLVGHGADAPTRERLRVVAERTAHPQLRVFIDDLAAEEPLADEALAEALAALEEADEQRGKNED